jgi:MraZ protein
MRPYMTYPRGLWIGEPKIMTMGGWRVLGLFLSTTINRIDKKGRVSVPASFRTALSGEQFQGVVLFQSTIQDAIEGVSMSSMEMLSNRMDQNFSVFSSDHDELATVLFGESIQLGFDGDGRITLPTHFIDMIGLNDEVAFVGLGQKFQIWHPDAFKKRKAEARKAVIEKKATLPKGGNT